MPTQFDIKIRQNDKLSKMFFHWDQENVKIDVSVRTGKQAKNR